MEKKKGNHQSGQGHGEARITALSGEMAGIGGEGRNFHFKHSKARVGSVLLATLSWLHWRPRIAGS